MTLLSGDELKQQRFFREGNPVKRASSFDLRVGSIFNDEGKKVDGPYVLQPNEMVQVTSAEVFALPDDITAHVSYKTGLTRKGIWALTVGVVDPGWNCPVSTTLFNFSKIPFSISEGDIFLRVSFFQHPPVSKEYQRVGPAAEEYTRGVQATAGAVFGRQFLNADTVAENAGKVATERMKDSAIKWVAGVAFVFTVLQLAVTWLSPAAVNSWHTAESLKHEIVELRTEIAMLTERIARSEEALAMVEELGEDSQGQSPDGAEN